MNYRGCPDASPLQRPDPEQLFPITRWEIPISKRRCCCSEFELHTQQPDGIITRTILRLNPEARAGDPEVRSRTPNIPNISRWRAEARPRQAIQLFCWVLAIRCYWDLFGFYGIFCWCNVNHTIFSTIHKFLQLLYDLIPRQAVDIFVGYMATSYH